MFIRINFFLHPTGGKRNADHSSSRSDTKREFGRGSDSQGGGKSSIKTTIWFMQVMKLGVANTSAGEQPTFAMHYWLKEKKQKSKYLKHKVCVRKSRTHSKIGH